MSRTSFYYKGVTGTIKQGKLSVNSSFLGISSTPAVNAVTSIPITPIMKKFLLVSVLVLTSLVLAVNSGKCLQNLHVNVMESADFSEIFYFIFYLLRFVPLKCFLK